jgi:hypothetical protein
MLRSMSLLVALRDIRVGMHIRPLTGRSGHRMLGRSAGLVENDPSRTYRAVRRKVAILGAPRRASTWIAFHAALC